MQAQSLKVFQTIFTKIPKMVITEGSKIKHEVPKKSLKVYVILSI